MPLLSDKAMVFMARGIHRKWKQPIAYYFNEGGMKADRLVSVFKEVISKCQSIGLLVRTTVCDQGAPNVKAIKYLLQETEEKKRKGQENKYFGFIVGGQEIIPLYDVPHLLKGIRNNFFQSQRCNFKWDTAQVETASWEHIRILYELEDPNSDYKLVNKLTEAHVHNLKKMKVSVAAQTLSARVAAGLRSLARLGMINL